MLFRAHVFLPNLFSPPTYPRITDTAHRPCLTNISYSPPSSLTLDSYSPPSLPHTRQLQFTHLLSHMTVTAHPPYPRLDSYSPPSLPHTRQLQPTLPRPHSTVTATHPLSHSTVTNFQTTGGLFECVTYTNTRGKHTTLLIHFNYGIFKLPFNTTQLHFNGTKQ